MRNELLFRNKWWHYLVVIAAISFFGVSCNKIKQELMGDVNASSSATTPKTDTSGAILETSTPSTESVILTPKEKRSFYTWLLNEMHQQIYMQPFPNVQEMLTWLNVLEQNGSLEGVYHGMILSTAYLDKEKGAAVKIEALNFFAEEAVLIGGDKNILDDKSKKVVAELTAKLSKTSVFTLKRELGAQIIKSIAVKKANRKKLAEWYADFVIRLAEKKVPFGMSERDKLDREFHRKWAEENNVELLQWESLNRAHRVFNFLQVGEAALDKPVAKPAVAVPAAATSEQKPAPAPATSK